MIILQKKKTFPYGTLRLLKVAKARISASVILFRLPESKYEKYK